VRYELSFDERFPSSDRIYRISAEVPYGQRRRSHARTSNFYPAGPQPKLDFAADVEQVAGSRG
jgi:hypothetical protein